MGCLVVLSGGCSSTTEDCFNGLDDDGNGAADCADATCAAVCQMDAGNVGTCAKCGRACAKQADCLAIDYVFDSPLPACLGGVCRSLEKGIQIALEIDTTSTWTGFSKPIQSVNTRFVRKATVDGGTVNCAVLTSVASSKDAVDADQIERSAAYNLSAYDVSRVTGSPGTIFTLPYVHVNVGGDFIIWTEFWSGLPDVSSKLPTGSRWGWGCFEAGAAVDPLTAADDKSPDSGVVGKTVRVKMPGPQ